MVFNRLPPFKSILELLSLISTLCVFRFLFPEFSFSAFEVPRFLGIPQRITGSLWFKCYFESRFVCIFRCLIFKVLLALPSRGQLTYCITHFCVCQYVFSLSFEIFSGLLSPASLVRQLCYYNKPIPTCQSLFSKFFQISAFFFFQWFSITFLVFPRPLAGYLLFSPHILPSEGDELYEWKKQKDL